MAIFRTQRIIWRPPGVIESPGKIFIEGQAHDATTLAPIFNQTWPSHDFDYSRALDQAMPTLSMSSRFWASSNQTVSIKSSQSMYDFSLTDAGQAKINYVYPSVNFPGTLIVGPDQITINSTAATSMAKFFNSQTLQFVGNATTNTFQSNTDYGWGGTYYETANSVFLVYNSNVGVTAAVNYRLYSVNTQTRVATVGSSEIQGNISNNAILVHESADNFYFMFHRYLTGISSVTTTTNNNFLLATIQKSSGVLTTRGTSTATTVGSGPAYFSSHAISTGTNTRAIFTAQYAATSGSKFSFMVTTFDVTVPGTAPVFTSVTPTNAASSAGTMTQTTQISVRTWAFTSGTTTYICAGCFDQATNTTATSISDYYVHVYKCPTSSPTTIQYVSSVSLSSSSRPKAIIPTDSSFSNLIVPMSGAVSFFYWDAANERYVNSSNLAVDPRYISIDQTGRIWISEANGSYNANLHVVSPTISSTIVVNFQNPGLTYSGSTISTNLLVSAYNFSGIRISNTVSLQLDTNSATFDDGTTAKTITTSATADTSVPIRITAAGYVRVLANLSI